VTVLTEHSLSRYAGVHGKDAERDSIRMTFARVEGNKKLAASILGISRRAPYDKLRRHRLA
jgi:transcriptional regulator of acetoin/glycerol metabolism